MPKTKRRELIESVILWMIEYKNTEVMEKGDESETAKEFEKWERKREANNAKV